MTDYKDRVLGSMFGGAVGDALGYPVEFMTRDEILARYGQDGINAFVPGPDGVAQISDDTQMSLFTAVGLLFGLTRMQLRGTLGAGPADYIGEAYCEWYQAQTGTVDYTRFHTAWIRDIKELAAPRAPGNTCMEALGCLTRHRPVENDSKGCGGIMRVAPVPLMLANDACHAKEAQIIRIAGDTAALTHRHPLGYLPAALMAFVIMRLLKMPAPTSFGISSAVDAGIEMLRNVYPDCGRHIGELEDIIDRARRLVLSSLSDADAIARIGGGWVAEETLAIALFCVLRYPDDFGKAVVASVTHSGDSDSTGAVTGNLMGAIVGYAGIPERFKDKLELSWLIKELSDDLSTPIPVGEYIDNSSPEQQRWLDRYVTGMNRDRVPHENTWLVDRRLMIYAGEYPGDRSERECRLKLGMWSKFAHFYDLTQQGELEPYSAFLTERQSHERFPVADCSVPSDTVSVRRLIERILGVAEKEAASDERIYRRTYIHCHGGVGRTGTIVACLYAFQLRGHGLTEDEIYRRAMRQLQDGFARCRKSKKRKSPENAIQKNFIRTFVRNECL